MIEVKCVGRGGQGAVTFAQLLSVGAFYEGYYVHAMPMCGVERRGAPSMSFTRISKKPILIRIQIYEPDYVVVLDSGLLCVKGMLSGLKQKGVVLANARKEQSISVKGVKSCFIDATSIALKEFGKDIVNTAMLGAFAAYTKLVSLENLYKAVDERFRNEDMRKKNKKVIKLTYEKCLEKI